MNHTESYAAAAFDHDTREEGKENDQALIDTIAVDQYAIDILSPSRWADALADLAYWPTPATGCRPAGETVQAMQALMTGDAVEFYRIVTEGIRSRIKETAQEVAETEVEQMRASA